MHDIDRLLIAMKWLSMLEAPQGQLSGIALSLETLHWLERGPSVRW